MADSSALRSRARRAARKLGYEVHRIPVEPPQPQNGDTPTQEEIAFPAGRRFDQDLVLERFLDEVRPRAVIDVGANVGQFAGWVREAGFSGPILSVEPLPAEHEQLTLAADADDLWTVAPRTALGSENGMTSINVAANSQPSSVLPILDAALENEPGSEYVDTIDTPVARLDDLLGRVDFDPAGGLLKVDTQGFEAEVLRGAPDALREVAAVQLELSLVPLYEGQALASELFSTLGDAGLELAYISEGFCAADGRPLQVDGCFVRP